MHHHISSEYNEHVAGGRTDTSPTDQGKKQDAVCRLSCGERERAKVRQMYAFQGGYSARTAVTKAVVAVT